ncbi:MAG TPA: BamA/TamA family outer membrane protein [Thermoanaerobaculia bacterium]|nr:BamA/TamA family outer membrane protein [Thermoanaerobaculia bacterium]
MRTLRLLSLSAALIGAVVFPDPLAAQYFGRNKVQWESFDFKVMQTDHFDIYYYEEAAPIIEDVARMSERWYTRLSAVFEHEFERKPIVLYANHPDFQQTNTTMGFVGEGTGGFTDSFMNRIVLPLTGTYEENDHVLGHEMVHVFQFDIANRLSTSRRRFQIHALPLWMIEGLAEYLTQGRLDPQTAMWVRDSAIRDDLPTLEKLTRDPRLSPYQFGQAFWAYVAGRWSDRAVIETFLAAGFLGPQGSIQRVLGVTPDELFGDWHVAARRLYEPVISDRWGPDRLGDPLLRQVGRNDIDVSPSLSPDGSLVAFLSSRELFSIDLFLADAHTGEILDRLVSSASDPHFDALRFIDSAGTWSPDGAKFAFVITERGDNRIAIVDVASRRIERRFKIPGVNAISQLAWSPDGRRLAFSGMSDGVSDLFVWDLASSTLSQITDDRYSDLQPAWAPDGRSIAVVSDRGQETDFNQLHYARPRITIIDLQTGSQRTLEIFQGAKHINPQFSPDGSSLMFIADPEGIADVFRVRLASGEVERLTHVATGVTGITDLSPALTVSSGTGDAIFTHFRGGRWTMYRVPARAIGPVGAEALADASMRGAFLPPPAPVSATPAAQVASYLGDPEAGLPPRSVRFTTDDYDPSLRLSYVGPPMIGAGYSGDYGTSIGGSFAALWSDVLGNHQVGLTVTGGTSSGDLGSLFGAETYYLNLDRRVQWGVAASHVPYVTAARTFYRQETIDIDGVPVLVDVYDRVLERTTVDEALFLTRYPFGTTRRVELNAGFTHLGYSAEVESAFVLDGQLLGTTRDDTAAPPSLTYYRAQTAFVGDSSFFGFVSPIAGTRYRYQAEAYTGDVEFQTGLADWRRYFFNRPVTLATRGFYYGRYGRDAEDPRISPLFIGYATTVRGYESGSFSASECTPTPGGGCPEFDRLIGSKIAVASIELRVPLFGTEDFGLFENPYFPTELVGFVDAGAAWTDDESVTWEFQENTTERVPVVSAGVAARILLGGYIPIQFYYAFPFQRPRESGGVFGFTIAPGW